MRSAILTLAAFLIAAGARCEFFVPDRESEVYYTRVIAAGEEISVDKSTEIFGNLHANGAVFLKLDTRVEGDVSATGEIESAGTISGDVTPRAPLLLLPAPLDREALLAAADQVIRGDTSFTDLVLDRVIFVGGSVAIGGTLSGEGTIISARDIRVRADTSIDAGSRISLISFRDLRIDKNRTFQGLLRAGRDVMLEQNVTVEGVIVANERVEVKKESRITFVDFDEVAPSVTLLAPEDGRVIDILQPEIQIGVSDDFSGLDLDTLRLELDGVEVTAEASTSVLGDGSVLIRFTPGSPLADGLHTIGIRISDRSGNPAEGSFTFTLATMPPTIAITAPRPLVLGDSQPVVRIEYAAGASALDLDSLRLELDDVDLTTGCDVTPTAASCASPELAEGAHVLVAEIRSVAGSPAIAHRDFEIVLSEGPHTVPLASGLADTTLDPASPRTAFGDAKALRLGADGSRVLVRLADETLLPLGSAELISAELRFDVASNSGGWGVGQEVDVHRARITEWDEAQATWDCPLESPCEPSWEGGVFDLAPTSSARHDDVLSGEVAFDVTSDIEAFLRTGENFGWLIKKRDETLPGSVEYAAREAGGGPRLVMVFATPEPEDPASDTGLPSLAFTEPRVPILLEERTTLLVVTYGDDGSGLDLASFRVAVDGLDMTASCELEPSFATCATPELTSAQNSAARHLATASIRDLAGNESMAELEILVIVGEGDVDPPVLVVDSPQEGALVNRSTLEVRGSVFDDGTIANIFVDGLKTPAIGGAWSATVQLAEGENPIGVTAVDGTGKRTETIVGVRLDSAPPVLEVLDPPEGFSTEAPSVVVRGTVADFGGALALVTVQGASVEVVDGTFLVEVPLTEGLNTITVEALDMAENLSVVTRQVELRAPPPPVALPRVSITSPTEGSLVAATEVTVTGTVSPGVSSVVVNGVSASLSGGSFTASRVPVRSGLNMLNAVGVDGGGRVGTATVTVIRDTDPPSLTLDFPRDGAMVFDSTIAVRGRAKDLDTAGADSPPLEVSVNGVAAEVSATSFLLPEQTLVAGENTLVVRAVDQAGNTAEVSATVRLETPARGRLRAVSGDLQEGTIGTLLPEPLVVEVLDAAGQPVPGRSVLFRVSGNNGFLDGGARQVAVVSDSAGRASTQFVLGTRAGAGSQVVEATAAGFAGPVVFHSTALPGPPAMVVVDTGAGQVGAVGEILPESLVAAVVDEGKNRLAGVAVEWSVVEGGGIFENGERQFTTLTDREGRALARFRLGPEEGVANHVVEASVLSVPEEFAAFVASGRAPGDPLDTAVSGLVLDNSDRPVPGVTVHIADTAHSTTTDADGRFRLDGIPVGLLTLEFDGSTTSRPGTWPHLEFLLNAIPGRQNDLGRPVYLLPIDVERGLAVSASAGGVLTLDEVPGFALEVAPGSVRFPDGTQDGVISVTLVNSAKVPMPPNFGQQPRFVITIQPSGARFDPPARLTLPNVDGLAPGQVTEMYSFDHDLFRFVSIGPATVSEDGTRVVSDPGFGVVEAGWHCGGDPSSSGTTHDCPICRECVRDRCVPDDGQTPEQRSSQDCQRQVCRGGSVTSVPNDGETPEQRSTQDCQRQICRGGSTVSVPDDQESPEQTPGNCTEARCSEGRPIFLTDLNDPPPGLECCGIQLSPQAPLIYDPATTCCLTDPRPRRVPRHPVQDLDECPGLSPHPGHVPMANGCGPEGGVDVPEDPVPGCPAFTPACDAHDLCWDRCVNSAGHKLGCDGQFLGNLMGLCRGCNNPVSFDLCQKAANLYAAAVTAGGWGAYYAAQREACQCCSN